MAGQTRVVVAVVIGLVMMTFSGELVRLPPLPEVLTGIPYLRSSLAFILDIASMLVLLRFVGGVSRGAMGDALGLTKPVRAAALMGAMIFIPALALMAAIGTPSDEASAVDLVLLGVVFPIAEEIAYRGLATGILLIVCGWRFWTAALLPAVVFGLGHATQGDEAMEIAGIVVITGLGGLLFSWLYLRFGHNLWPAIIMHSGMNLIWSAFDMGENAIGGWVGNAMRVAVVAAAIALTIWAMPWLRRVSGESVGLVRSG
jgi:uncharacterized protein